MGVMDYLKAGAMSFISPPKKPKMNPSMKHIENPTYEDLNRDGEDPILRPKKVGNILNPAKDAGKDISRDKHGHYITTMTYPLPPIKWEKKQFEKNRRARNSKNNYL